MPEQLNPQDSEALQLPSAETGIRPAEFTIQGPELATPPLSPEAEALQKRDAVQVAGIKVHEAREGSSLDSVIGGLDFSKDNYRFVASDNYTAEATTGERSTRVEGSEKITGPFYKVRESGQENKWGNPRDEAWYGHQPVEKVGIRKGHDREQVTVEKRVPMHGWRGKLGFKTNTWATETRDVEPTYTFDYEFAAPSHGEDEAALDAGNRTGQNIRLSLQITREQAEELSAQVAKDPLVARKILDTFVRKTGDAGMWDADVFDAENKFIDPAGRYGKEFLARDVRPRYEAVPDLKPEIVSLLEPSDLASAVKTAA